MQWDTFDVWPCTDGYFGMLPACCNYRFDKMLRLSAMQMSRAAIDFENSIFWPWINTVAWLSHFNNKHWNLAGFTFIVFLGHPWAVASASVSKWRLKTLCGPQIQNCVSIIAHITFFYNINYITDDISIKYHRVWLMSLLIHATWLFNLKHFEIQSYV